MANIDYDSLIKFIPNFHKFLLDNVEKEYLKGDFNKAKILLEDYQLFKKILLDNNVHCSKFDTFYKTLERKLGNISHIDDLKKSVVESYESSRASNN